MHRLFVATRPPESIRDQLLDLMEGSDLRWQSDEQLHLTLRFIGEVDRRAAETVAEALASVRAPRFDLALAGIGVFDHGRRGALWAAVAPKEPVRALATKIERICQSAGLPPERRAFHPHITLARWSSGKPPLGRFAERHAALASPPWSVTDFSLYQSHLGRDGAHYEEIARYALG